MMGTNLELPAASSVLGTRSGSPHATMKVIQVVPSIEEHLGGPSYSVPALCRALAEQQARVSLHVLAPAPAQVEQGYELREHPWRGPITRLGFSPEMKRALREEAGTADVVHNHSLWMMPN